MVTETLDNAEAIKAHEILETATIENNDIAYSFAALANLTRLIILFTLSRTENGMDATDICLTLKITRDTMNGHMKHLVGVGQVERETREDDIHFSIAPSARALMKKLIPAYFN